MDEHRLARHASARHGVFDRPTLDRLGVDPRQIRRYEASGRWRRLHENVWAAATTPDSFEVQAEAALAAAPHGALGLRTAAIIHGWQPSSTPVDLCVEHHRTARLAGVRVHRTVLPAHHVTRRRGWRVTTVERTLIDLGKVMGVVELQDTIEEAVRNRQTTIARVEATFGDLAQRGRPGIGRARRVLGLLDPEAVPESKLEAMFFRLIRRERLPEPVGQASFEWLGSGRGRVDAWYPDRNLIIELDGRRFHDRSAQFEADRRRDQLGVLEGITTVRITHRQLRTERQHVLRVLRGLLT